MLARWPLLRVLAQFLLDITLRRDQAHQRFGLMSVKLIGDKDPGRLGVSLNGLSDVSGKVGFGARGSNAGSHDLSGGHVQVGNQTQGAMPLVFKFLSLDGTQIRKKSGSNGSVRLNSTE